MSTFCHFHNDQPSTHACAVRKQPLCSCCANVFTVNQCSSTFSGEPICPDCVKEMAQDNANELNQNIKTIKRDFTISIIGIVIGFILGLILGASGGFGSALIFGLIFAGIGGMFLSFIKFYLSLVWEGIKAIFSFEGIGYMIGALLGLCINMVVGIVKCIYYSIKNTIDYISYLRDTADILKTDAEAVQWVDDYLAYTYARSQYPDEDLTSLMEVGRPLNNNVFAQSVAVAGEAAAIEHVRSHVTLVALSFEIVHDFDD